METYASESASYRAAFDIEEKINELLEQGVSHQEAELKGVEEFAIECSILKVSVSEKAQNVQTKEFKFLEGWASLQMLLWKWHGEMHV